MPAVFMAMVVSEIEAEKEVARRWGNRVFIGCERF